MDKQEYPEYDEQPSPDSDVPTEPNLAAASEEFDDLDSDDDYARFRYEPPTTRPNRARERVQRRKHATPTTATGTARITQPIQSVSTRRLQQVVPSGESLRSRLLATFRTMRPLLYAIGAVVLVVGIIVALRVFTVETVTEIQPNAIWLGTEWTYENRGEAAVQTLTGRLREHRIGTAYAWVSWLKVDGQWAGTRAGTNQFADMEANVRIFTSQFKAAYPEAQLYGWVSFPVEDASIPYRMNDPVLQQAVADFSYRVVTELGFDGVFLNIEPVWNNRQEDFIALLNRVRLRIGPEPDISVAIPPDWTPLNVDIPQPRQVTPGTEWDKAFKQRVALLTDEMAIMAYNSGLTTPFDYIDWMAYQVQSYAEAVDEVEIGTRVVIGIPTYDNELPGHDVMVENVSSALSGVKQGLAQAGEAADTITGLAIYAEWTTGETEWLQFKQGDDF